MQQYKCAPQKKKKAILHNSRREQSSIRVMRICGNKPNNRFFNSPREQSAKSYENLLSQTEK